MATLLEQAQLFLADPRGRAYLDVVANAEGAVRYGSQDGYDVLFGGELFSQYGKGFDSHPMIKKIANGEPTYAAGRYQINKVTYNDFAKRLGLTDFSPETQDLIAAAIVVSTPSAIESVLSGNIQQANEVLKNRWVALPSTKNNKNPQNAYNVFNTSLERYSDGQFSPAVFRNVKNTATDTGATTGIASVYDRTMPPAPFANTPGPPAHGNVQARIQSGIGQQHLAISTDPMNAQTYANLTDAFANPQGVPVVEGPTRHFTSPNNVALVGNSYVNTTPVNEAPAQMPIQLTDAWQQVMSDMQQQVQPVQPMVAAEIIPDVVSGALAGSMAAFGNMTPMSPAPVATPETLTTSEDIQNWLRTVQRGLLDISSAGTKAAQQRTGSLFNQSFMDVLDPYILEALRNTATTPIGAK